MDIKKILEEEKLLPIVTLREEKNIQNVKNVIENSNIKMIEVAFRSKLAVKAIKEYSSLDDVIVGAGTVRTLDEAKKAIEAGAQFIVSPSYDSKIVKFAQTNNILVLPGILTPSEIQKGINEASLSIFKLFPANLIGGLSAIKSLKGPFYDVKFLPTGGVNQDNYLDFLEDDQVIAVGGSFIIDDTVEEKDIKKEIEKVNLLIEKINKRLKNH